MTHDSIIIAHSLGAHFIPKYITEKNIEIETYISCADFMNKTHKTNIFDKIMDEFIPTESQIDKALVLMKHLYAYL